MLDSPHTWSQQAWPALVLLGDVSGSGLWNPQVGQLASDLEERLEDVHVTFAGLDGNSPTLEDAVAAAWVMGAPAVVVAVPEELAKQGVELSREPGRRPIPTFTVSTRWSADAIAEAYRRMALTSARRG